jgi:hypothetical protein
LSSISLPKLDDGSKEAAFFAYPILPYIEQDHLYKMRAVAGGDVTGDRADEVLGLAAADFNDDGAVDGADYLAARDSLFAQIGADRRQGIIAVLIGL